MQALDFKEEYRSDRDNLVLDFYIPCLEKSRFYDRAVGFFSSTSLAAVAQGLAIFIRAGGRMRLIASPLLSEEDIEAIARGLKQRQEIIEQSIVHELEKEVKQVVRDRVILFLNKNFRRSISWIFVASEMH